jgi:hypothetical protein
LVDTFPKFALNFFEGAEKQLPLCREMCQPIGRQVFKYKREYVSHTRQFIKAFGKFNNFLT